MDTVTSADGTRIAFDRTGDEPPNAGRRTLDGQGHGAAPEVIVPVLADFFA